MSNMDQKTIKDIKNDATNILPEKKRIKIPTKQCSECMVDFITCLTPAPKKNSKIKQVSRVKARIKKICEGKIIICGILHKTICYTALSNNNSSCETRYIKHKKIPFSCCINIDCQYLNDRFEIVDCKVLCNDLKVINKKSCCSNKAILAEKDLVKITVKRTLCTNNCKNYFRNSVIDSDICFVPPVKPKRALVSFKVDSNNNKAILAEKNLVKIADKRKPCINDCKNYFGNSVINSEICFVPAVNPKKALVSVKVDQNNFKVLLISCDLIVVSGVITKTVNFNDGTPTAKKDILVEVNVPVSIEDLKKVDVDKWEVTQAEISDGCYCFTCPNEDATLYHKLIEKDILSVEVAYKHKTEKE